MLKRHRYTILFIGWVLFITMLSLFSLSGIETEEVYLKIPHIDKITHFFFYFFFVFLCCFFVMERRGSKILGSKTILGIILVAICYGLLIEGLQWLMPFQRAAEIWDAMANTFGAILGGLLTKAYISLNYRSK